MQDQRNPVVQGNPKSGIAQTNCWKCLQQGISVKKCKVGLTILCYLVGCLKKERLVWRHFVEDNFLDARFATPVSC